MDLIRAVFPFLSHVFGTSVFLFPFYTAYLEGSNDLNPELHGAPLYTWSSAALQFERNGFALAGVAQWIDCKAKGYQFDSQSGHMPGFRARSPVGGA